MRLVMDRRRSPVWIPACAGMTGEGWCSPSSSWARPRIQSYGRRAAGLWILTFVRMTVGMGAGACPPAPSSPRRRGSIVYAVGDGSPAVARLDPRLRGDDGGGVWAPFRHPGLDPGPRVAGGGAAWLWVPTFVGMTERGEDGTGDDGTGDDGKGGWRDGGRRTARVAGRFLTRVRRC